MIIDDLQNLEVVSEPTNIRGGLRSYASQQDSRVRTIVYTSGNSVAEAYSYVYSRSTSINGETTSYYYSEQSSSSS